MAAPVCLSCGRELASAGTFCPWCGTSVASAKAATLETVYTTKSEGWRAERSNLYAPSRRTSDEIAASARRLDVTALSQISSGALAGVVGTVFGYLTLFAITSVFPPLGGSKSGEFLGAGVLAFFAFALVAVLVTVTLTVFQFAFYRRGFGALASTDSRFSTPAGLALVALLVSFVFGALLIVLLSLSYSALQCAGSDVSIPTSCINAPEANAFLILSFVCLFILFIGYLGIVIGVWRLGRRYNSGLLLLGALLHLVPFVNVSADVVVYLGVRWTRRKVRSNRLVAESE